MARTYKPITLDVVENDRMQAFQIHKGQPGAPRIYREGPGGSLRRVKRDDPILRDVAAELRRGVDEKKAAEEKELKRVRGWKARFFRWVGEHVARIWFSAFPKS